MSEEEMNLMDKEIEKENAEQGDGEDQLADMGVDDQQESYDEVEAFYANSEPSIEEKQLVESMSKLLEDVDVDELFEDVDDE